MDAARLIPVYLGAMHRRLRRAPDTVRRQRSDLKRFMEHLAAERTPDLADLNRDVVVGFQEQLATALRIAPGRTEHDRPLALASQVSILVSVRGFLRWLHREGYLHEDLSRAIVLPRHRRSYKRQALTAREWRALLAVINVATPYGLRDRAMIETAFATGIRLNGIVHVRLEDLDLERRLMLLTTGKGGKQQILPLTRPAVRWLEVYRRDGRPLLTRGEDPGWLFLNRHGDRISKRYVSKLVTDYAAKAGIQKRITPHSLRVTVATEMIRHGADIAHVQALLGHEQLTTTQYYLRLSARDLRKAIDRHHPRESPPDEGDRPEPDPGAAPDPRTDPERGPGSSGPRDLG